MSNYDEARKFATDYLRERRGLLTPEVGREFESVQMAIIISLLWSTLGKQALDEQARELVKAAATSPAAYGAARHMVLYHIDHDKPLPPALEQFHRAVLMGAAPPESKTGWGSANYGRDATIACIVNELVGRFGLKCTRNSASKKPSACSIVADALAKSGCAISEKAVERVVGKMDRLGVVFYFSRAED